MKLLTLDADISRFLVHGNTASPHVALRRNLSTEPEWFVLNSRIDAEEPALNADRRSEAVLVPMISYSLPSDDPRLLAKLGIQVSTAVISRYGLQDGDTLIMAVGNVLDRQDGKPGKDVWLGVAFKLGER